VLILLASSGCQLKSSRHFLPDVRHFWPFEREYTTNKVSR